MLTAKDLGSSWTACGRSWGPVSWRWAMPENGKVALIAGVTKDLTAKVHAGKLMQALAPMVGGKGGGRPDLAEAGAKTRGPEKCLIEYPSLLEGLL